MDKQKWEIQNKLYQMKEKKAQLERFIRYTKEHYEHLNNFTLFKKREDETTLEFIIDVIKLFITGLDIVLGFYYIRFKAFYILKKAQKEIVTLTKEIEKYDY